MRTRYSLILPLTIAALTGIGAAIPRLATQKFGPLELSGNLSTAQIVRHPDVDSSSSSNNEHDEDPRRLALAAARRQVAQSLRPLRPDRELEPLPPLPGRLRQRVRHHARHAHQAYLPGREGRQTLQRHRRLRPRCPRRVQVRERAARGLRRREVPRRLQPARRPAADHLGRVRRLSPPRPRQRPRPLLAFSAGAAPALLRPRRPADPVLDDQGPLRLRERRLVEQRLRRGVLEPGGLAAEQSELSPAPWGVRIGTARNPPSGLTTNPNRSSG